MDTPEGKEDDNMKVSSKHLVFPFGMTAGIHYMTLELEWILKYYASYISYKLKNYQTFKSLRTQQTHAEMCALLQRSRVTNENSVF